MMLLLFSLISLMALGVEGQIQLYQYGLNATASLSDACNSTLSQTLDCNPYLYGLATTDFFGPLGNESFHGDLCDSACGDSLAAYHTAVEEKCADDPEPWDGVPAVWAGDVLWSTYNRTCLKDPETGRYCTDQIGEISAAVGDTDTSLTTLSTEQLCSPCILILIEQMQKTAYSNYNENLVDKWVEIQSACGTGALPTEVQPPATNMTVIPGVDYSDPSESTCLSDNFYTTRSDDDIQAIADANGVPTGPLKTLNGIFPDGSNLKAEQVLCLPRKCPLYLVQQGDSCGSISAAHNISTVNLLGYNPNVNRACSNLPTGETICVGLSGTKYTPTAIEGATITKTNEYATATVQPSGPTAHDTTDKCGKYYKVVDRDTCEIISLRFAISVSLFMAINPSVDEDCFNLTPSLYYCIFPMQNWNATTDDTTTSTYVTAPAPTPTGTTSKCYKWHVVATGESCYLIQQSYGITFRQFQTWNPQIDSECASLLSDTAYCVQGTPGNGSSSTLDSPASTTTV